jgi:hypothetical protein
MLVESGVDLLMKRSLSPEILDNLPAEDIRAMGSRRDLRKINWIMGHVGILASALRPALSRANTKRIVELGAGDGSLILRLIQQLDWRVEGGELLLLDRCPVVEKKTIESLRQYGWQVEIGEMDVFNWAETESRRFDICVANLFLHHFDDTQLSQLFLLLQDRVDRLVACEPDRSHLSLLLARLVGLIGCNAVTRHDAVISVRAGFSGSELTPLWPNTADGIISENKAGLFTHFFYVDCLRQQ